MLASGEGQRRSARAAILNWCCMASSWQDGSAIDRQQVALDQHLYHALDGEGDVGEDGPLLGLWCHAGGGQCLEVSWALAREPGEVLTLLEVVVPKGLVTRL